MTRIRRMRLFTILAVLIGISYNSAWAQIKIDFQELTLDNGLHVIMHQDNSVPIVTASVLYHVGSKDEDPERTGFAHFFEHLLFEGSENIGRGDYMKVIQSAGGSVNAFTTHDFTYYYQTLPSNQLELALYMESERMLHAKIDQVGVETQREVVKEEKRERIDNQPYGTMVSETMKRAFTVHPYHWMTLGSMDHLNAATLEEFMKFYEKYYVPNNAILTIAGDFEYSQAEEWVRLYFSEVPKGNMEIRKPMVVEPKKTMEIRDIIYDNIQVPAVIQAYNLPPKNHPDSYAFEMLSTYLTGGNSSLMTKDLVDKKQKAAYVAAIPLELEEGGIFVLYGMPNMGVEAKDLESEFDIILKKVQTAEIPEKEFRKLQNIIENNWVDKNSTIAGIAQNLAEAKVFYGDTDYINRELQQYRKVTRNDLKRVANEYLTINGRVVLHYLPKSAQPAN